MVKTIDPRAWRPALHCPSTFEFDVRIGTNNDNAHFGEFFRDDLHLQIVNGPAQKNTVRTMIIPDGTFGGIPYP